MIAIVLSLLTAAQAPDAAPQPVAAEARIALERVGSCIATRGPLKAAKTLNLDFTTRQYDDALRALLMENRACVGRNRQARIAGVLAAGAIAEGLLKVDGGKLLARLPAAAAVSSAAPHSPSDLAMMCVIRRSPADVARLFGSVPASTEEKAAIATVMPVLASCLDGGRQARLNVAGLRAVLATAAYRLVAAPPAAKS